MSVVKANTETRGFVSLSQILKFAFIDLAKRFPGAQRSLIKAVWALRTISANSKASVGEFFLKTVNKHPDNTVLFHLEDKWTYKEFNEWVNRLANHFLSLGFKKGDVAVVFLDNRPEVLAICMAMSKIGGVASLLNYSQRKQSLVHSINLSKPKLVLVGSELMDSFLEIQNDIPGISAKTKVIQLSSCPAKTDLEEFDIVAKSSSKEEPKINFDIHAKDPYMYVFTSGTTGLPKAAIVTHGRWIKGYCGFGLALLQLTEKDILYVPLPFYHSTAMIVCWTSVVAGGAGMVLKRKFSVKEFWPDVHKYNVTGFGYVGELCKYLLNAPVNPLEKNSTLKKMIGNGLRPSIWMEFKERFGIEQIAEFYASSEGNLAFFNLFNVDRTMGYSVNKYAIVEYDKENEKPVLNKKGRMKEVGKGGIGLLLGEISDRYPFDGYTEKEKSEKSIVRNVLKKGDAYFNTGDLVYDMGFHHAQFVDRLGDTYRWKSENVSTTEVEGIINQYKGIAESIVYGVEIPNNPGRAGMANLILADNTKEIDFAAFLEFIKNELPSYAIPLFLRISKGTLTTETMKHQKNHLKEAGYDCDKISDPLYFLMPDEGYVRLTPEIRDYINKGDYKL